MIVALVSLGCPKNRVDSELILGEMVRRGYEVSTTLDGADEVIINTCGFIRPAVEESISTIEWALDLKRRGRVRRVWVVGCLVQRYGRGLKALLPKVDGFLGIDHLRWVGLKRGVRVSTPTMGWSGGALRVLSTSGYAYLRIADGCDNRCSYCLLPRIRGRYRSRPIEEVVEEASRLVGMGVKELILVAQDTTLYGVDLYGSPQIPRLIRALSRLEGVHWLRLLYTHPGHYTEELIAAIRETEKLRYLDLPLQHIADPILKRMNRGYSRAEVESLLSRLRSIPNLVLRTTFLAGFPGETELQFSELLRFVEAERFDWVGCFPYYREGGTPAYGYPAQVPERVKSSRREELLRVQAEVSAQARKGWKGRRLEVMVEDGAEVEGYRWVGRSYRESPEVDGVVYVRGEEVTPGQLCMVEIEETTAYDSYAVVVKDG